MWTMMLTTAVIYIGLAWCIIPGIYFALAYSLVAPVFMIEGLQSTDAMRRSGRLASGHFWRIFVVLLLAVILSLIVAWTFSLGGSYLFLHRVPFAHHTSGRYPASALVAASLLRSIGSSLARPIWLIATVLLYYDIRVRKEGFDVELLAQSLGEPLPYAADEGGAV
jgi:hypothetical protein